MKIAVVGGGAAGMMAAYASAISGANVTLYEKNEKLGKKLFITGKGRCNVTNSCEIEDFFANIPTNSKFLYSALYTFTNDALMQLLEENGLELKTERGGRVFPVSDKSSDVLSTFRFMLSRAKVDVRLNTEVVSIDAKDGKISGVTLRSGRVKYDAVILATGGVSYKSTGSNGQGFSMVTKTGHSVTELKPSLIPMVCRENTLCKKLQGLSLKNVSVELFEGKKSLYKEQGEMLFTHFGVSGPLILSASAHLRDYTFSDTRVVIDLKPALSEQKLDARILRDFDENKNRSIANSLRGLFPGKLAEVMPEILQIDGSAQVNSVTKQMRAHIVNTTKNLTFRIEDLRSIDEAIITRGGVNVKEIDAATMQSKIICGLFVTGEMLDLDAYTGGFNLQIAFSTGYLAGISAAM